MLLLVVAKANNSLAVSEITYLLRFCAFFAFFIAGSDCPLGPVQSLQDQQCKVQQVSLGNCINNRGGSCLLFGTHAHDLPTLTGTQPSVRLCVLCKHCCAWLLHIKQSP
jgi:hypothetical protein